MQRSYLSRSYPAPFYLLDPDTIHLLNKFVYNKIKFIPHPMRFNIINKHNNNNLQCFINLSGERILDKYEKAPSSSRWDYTEISNLYRTMVLLTDVISGSYISKEDFDIRCILIEGLLDVSTKDMRKYLTDSPLKFHLFAFLYKIIVKQTGYTESKQEILNHLFCYSNKYEKLTSREAANKLGVTSQAVRMAEQTLERKINDVIKMFRIFGPYYSYRLKYLSNAEITRISPEIFECIRKEEGVKEMTDIFIATVLSVIYNYNLTIGEAEGKPDYLLVQRGSELNKIIRFRNPEAEKN